MEELKDLAPLWTFEIPFNPTVQTMAQDISLMNRIKTNSRNHPQTEYRNQLMTLKSFLVSEGAINLDSVYNH